MSVVSGKRKEGKLQVLRAARELVVYTLKACKNEKVFPKAYRWMLTQKIVNEAMDILGCIRRANATMADTEMNYQYRHQQQSEAYAHTEALLAFIDIAYEVLGIESRRVEYWTGLAVNTESKLQGWSRSTTRQWTKDSTEDPEKVIPLPASENQENDKTSYAAAG